MGDRWPQSEGPTVVLFSGHLIDIRPRSVSLLPFRFARLPPTTDCCATCSYSPHCLNAGGTGSVKAANGGDFVPYDPLDATAARARAGDHGACGDKASDSPGAHAAGGQFYHGGKSVASYRAGGTVDFQVAITTAHGGFLEWWVCNLDACGQEDINDACFAVPGACAKLDRVPKDSCESGDDALCGPVQREHPSRWYLPCRGDPIPTTNGPQVLGGPDGRMRYRLPTGFACTRCVMQWYWGTCEGRGALVEGCWASPLSVAVAAFLHPTR